jgi:hypothetical protein
MIRKSIKFIIAVFASALISLPAMAQMTDEAVYNYVKDGLSAGKSQDVLVKELVAGLAQQHEPSRIEVRVVGLEFVVDMQVLDAPVLLATEVARTVVGGKHPFAEHLPLRSLSELLVLVRLFL